MNSSQARSAVGEARLSWLHISSLLSRFSFVSGSRWGFILRAYLGIFRNYFPCFFCRGHKVLIKSDHFLAAVFCLVCCLATILTDGCWRWCWCQLRFCGWAWHVRASL